MKFKFRVSDARGARAVRLAALMASVVLILGAPARAQFHYRQTNLAYLAQRADVIVQGRVVEARYEPMPGYDHIPTVVVTLQVERMLRGPEGSRYTFREMLPFLKGNRSAKMGYAHADRLMLFLPAPSEWGLSGPLGGEQGRFHIQSDQWGRAFIANEFNNAGLFKGVAEKAYQEGLELSETQTRIAQLPRGPAALEDFVSLVEGLTKLPRIQ